MYSLKKQTIINISFILISRFILFQFYPYIYILFYYIKNIWEKIFMWVVLILYLKR